MLLGRFGIHVDWGCDVDDCKDTCSSEGSVATITQGHKGHRDCLTLHGGSVRIGCCDIGDLHDLKSAAVVGKHPLDVLSAREGAHGPAHPIPALKETEGSCAREMAIDACNEDPGSGLGRRHGV